MGPGLHLASLLGLRACGQENRPGQARFACTSCGFAEHVDVNAARNIAARGVTSWAVSHAA
ncbi:zinc ribbon domain-containing protein [Nonomuraea cavernae]|uniref:zinc ribbon domain-containing protein n=1 Tax=Nonomuraea cavernae TaxID=2045107 RepID=UPI0033DB585D